MGAEVLLFGAIALLLSNLQSGRVRLFGGPSDFAKTLPQYSVSDRPTPPPPPDQDITGGTGDGFIVSGQDAINRGTTGAGAVRP